jgi:hypothetical protein
MTEAPAERQAKLSASLAGAALLLALFLSSPRQARAADEVAHSDDEDVLSSVYTENGFELKRDDRLFALYAAFNIAGYNRAEITRTLPYPKYSLHPLRSKVRKELLAGEKIDKVRAGVEKYIDSHQVPLEEYVAAALTLAPAAPYAPTPETPKSLAGLDKMLADFSEGAHLSKVSSGLANDYREILKKMRAAVDGPFLQLRKTYRLNEEQAPALALVPNPLDTPEVAIARKVADGSHLVIFGLPGPEGTVDLQAALRAYSALLAGEVAKGVMPDGLSAAVEKLHADGVLARDITEDSIIRESLRAAVDAKLWAKDASGAVDDALHKGLIFAPEFLKALDEPADAFPAASGSFAAQVAGRLNIEKALTQVGRGPTIHK